MFFNCRIGNGEESSQTEEKSNNFSQVSRRLGKENGKDGKEWRVDDRSRDQWLCKASGCKDYQLHGNDAWKVVLPKVPSSKRNSYSHVRR